MRRKKEDHLMSLVYRFEEESDMGHSVYFDAEDFEQIAGYYLEQGDTEKGSQAIQSGLKIHPNSEILYIKKVELYLQTNRVDAAMLLLDKLPKDDDADMLRAAALLKQHKEKAAMNLLYKQIKENPNKDDICLDVAELLLSNNIANKALPILKIGMAYNPHNKELYFAAADACDMLGVPEKALPFYQHVLNEDPYDWMGWKQMGDTLSFLERYTEALEAYEFAIIAAPEQDDSLLKAKGEVLLQVGRYDQGIDCLKEVLPRLILTEVDEAILSIAEGYEKKDDYEEAILWYKKELSRSILDDRAYIGWGLCAMELGRYEESLQAFQEVLSKSNYTSAEAWAYTAECYLKEYKVDFAIDAFQSALKASVEESAEINFSLANAYFQKKDYQQALIYYQATEKIDATINNLYLFEALAYVLSGQKQASEEALKLAMDQDPNAKMLFEKLFLEESAL